MDEPSGSYAPRSPDLTPLNSFPSHDTQPNMYSQPQPPPPRFRESFSLPSTATFPLGQQPPQLSQQQSQPAAFSQQPSFFRQDSSSLTDQFAFSQSPGPHPAYPQPAPSRTRIKRDPAEEEWQPPSAGPEPSSATPFTSMKQEDMDQLANLKAPGEDEGIVVKTKFPVARIKRIVQADEDVGKVAQVTPVVVSKALELFMISLALKTAEEARSRNSKRVTASHLKQIVLKDEQFDFLGDIVSKIQDAPTSKDKESKSKAKDEEDGDDDIDSGGAAPKRRKAATRRRRKDREDS